MPKWLRPITFIPYLIVIVFIVVIARATNWVFVLVFMAVGTGLSILFGMLIVRRSKRRRTSRS